MFSRIGPKGEMFSSGLRPFPSRQLWSLLPEKLSFGLEPMDRKCPDSLRQGKRLFGEADEPSGPDGDGKLSENGK